MAAVAAAGCKLFVGNIYPSLVPFPIRRPSLLCGRVKQLLCYDVWFGRYFHPKQVTIFDGVMALAAWTDVIE